MPKKANPSKLSAKPGLRMNELVNATGVAKSTILHYVNEGLLPDPVKTSQNMAYYAPESIDRIQYIQHLQQRHRLTLAEIHKLLNNRTTEDDDAVYLGLNEIIFGNLSPGSSVDRRRFCDQTGLKDEQVTALIDARLLQPLEQDRFDSDDISMGKLYARGNEAGIGIEDMTYYVELGEKIVDHEMALRRRLTHHLPYEQDAAFTIELVKNARMSRAYIIDRLFQHRVADMPDLKETQGPQ